MVDRPEGPHTDERLSRLLDVEHRIEARIRQAEAVAQARVAAAREASRRAGHERSADFDAAARAEAAADLERHAAALRAIQQESAASTERLASVTGDALERLARRAVAIVLDPQEGAPP
jgi:hypothetical protein